ncbi:MAG TPA: L-rhamnose mutarotase [Sedimentisphaerales bacterium]|nr:L-rhamnose mutarotase [Sedimentisphaerales bacterium]
MKKTSIVVWAVVILVSVTLITGCCQQVTRHGSVISIDKGNICEYNKLHANVWPGVLKNIRQSNIENYSIYSGQTEADKYYLFSYYEYSGCDYKKDMAKMAKDKEMQKWSDITLPMLKPLEVRKEGEYGAEWEEVFHYAGPAYKGKCVKRIGSIIGIEEKNILAYTQLHKTVWPGVLASIEKCNIRNYSIYLGQIERGNWLLFSYFEYIGNDFEGDMAKIGDEVTKVWWTYTDPLQRPLPTRKEGEHWATMEEIFHTN